MRVSFSLWNWWIYYTWKLEYVQYKEWGNYSWVETESSPIASEPSDSRSVSLGCQLYLGLAKEPDALVVFHHIAIALQRTKIYKYENAIFAMYFKYFYFFYSDKNNINTKYIYFPDIKRKYTRKYFFNISLEVNGKWKCIKIPKHSLCLHSYGV